MEGEIAFGLLDRFDTISLALPPGDLVWRPSRVMRGLRHLPVLLG